MTKTLNIKAVAAVVGIALALSLGLGFAVQSAGAQSMSMSQLVDLFIQLGIIAPDKAAAAQAAVTTSTTSSMGTTYTRDLTVGSTGADVTALQMMLGVSPATGYFGSITKAAVTQYQAQNGIPATGYFGPLTRAKVNASVVVTTTTTTTTTGGVMTGSGEGFLDDIEELSSVSTEEVGEDEEDVQVLGLEMIAEDADQQIDRVIVDILTPTGNDDLEDLITDVSVWLDDELLGRMDVEDGSHDRTADEYTFRFTGLDGVIEEGDLAELFVAVSGVSNLDGTDSGDGWTARIPANGIRAVSPNGTDDFYPSTLISEAFTVETFASANSIELAVAKDSSSPDTQSVEVDDSDDTDGVELLVFRLNADGSDIEVNDIPVLFTISSTTAQVSSVANTVTLEIDGEEFSETVITTGGATRIVTFDDLDLTIEDGDTVTVVVTADINDLDTGVSFDSGTSLKAELTSTQVDAIDAEDESGEDITDADATGTALGEEQSFYADGVSIEFVSATEVVSDTADGETNDRGTYTLRFNVTSFGADAYIASTTASTSAAGTQGVEWSIIGNAFTGTETANLTSSGDEETASFLVEDGQTEEFVLTVVLVNTAGTAGFYGIQVDTVRFNESNSGAIADYTAVTSATGLPDDIETDEVNLET